jgi:hypothetical protein
MENLTMHGLESREFPIGLTAGDRESGVNKGLGALGSIPKKKKGK